jgi:hypothetical protein
MANPDQDACIRINDSSLAGDQFVFASTTDGHLFVDRMTADKTTTNNRSGKTVTIVRAAMMRIDFTATAGQMPAYIL